MNHLVTRPELVSDAIAAWAQAPILGLDTETRGLNWWRDPLVGISVATHTDAWYFPFGHKDGPNLPAKCALQLRDALEHRRLVGASLNFDWHILRRVGWLQDQKQPPAYHDVTIAAYSLDENQPLKLETLAKRYLGIDGAEAEDQLMADIAVVLGKKRAAREDKQHMWLLHPSQVAPYACADAKHCIHLLDTLIPLLREDRTWNSYLNLVEYQRALHEMEENGLPVNKDVMQANWSEAEERRDELAHQIRTQSKGAVENPNSAQQLAKWLGLPKTDKDTLSKVVDDPRVYLIQDYRKLAKACSTYYAAISGAVGEGTILHPTLRLTGAVVRLSATNPNTQAVPRDSSEIYKIKPFFESADPETDIGEVDLSQAEIAMAAHYTKDEALVKAVREGFDLHTAIANIARDRFGVEADRNMGKTTNFAVQYGVGADKLANMLRQPYEVGKAMIHAHRAMYPGIAHAYKLYQKEFEALRRITLWSGRVRHLTNSGKPVKIHAAFNNRIQGGVSEQMRVAIVRMAREVPEFKMGLTVHDSIIGTSPRKYRQEIGAEMFRIMTDWPWMDPPTSCDIAFAPSWDLCKKKENHWSPQ